MLSSLRSAFLLLGLSPLAANDCDLSVIVNGIPSSEIVCPHLHGAAPTLDGDLSDWSNVPENVMSLVTSIGAVEYAHGDVAMKCTYDDDLIYMAWTVKGPYRFNATNDRMCASISTMWKVGPDAQYLNMGACPSQISGLRYDEKCAEVPEACYAYRVDLGLHWELKTTEQGVAYGIDLESNSGNDLSWNKDDEWAVGPYCRPDDNDSQAQNEWSAAWVHTDNSTDGYYIFESSRLLRTGSVISDVQLEAGEEYDFGFSYWDPYERLDIGWTKAGHYVTGCGKEWITLRLAEDPDAPPPTKSSSGAASLVVQASLFMTALVAFFALI
mmetsp:Transcript_27068/g.40971  ORF Transcript_27068/g.40971 Transcript_27068/m.40971 type:complete len:326 (-) Transcript_27068:86-1063(-)